MDRSSRPKHAVARYPDLPVGVEQVEPGLCVPQRETNWQNWNGGIVWHRPIAEKLSSVDKHRVSIFDLHDGYWAEK